MWIYIRKNGISAGTLVEINFLSRARDVSHTWICDIVFQIVGTIVSFHTGHSADFML